MAKTGGSIAEHKEQMRQLAAWVGFPWQDPPIALRHAHYINSYKRPLMRELIENAHTNSALDVGDPRYISHADLVQFAKVPRTALTLHREMNEEGYHVGLVEKDGAYYLEKALLNFAAARKSLAGDESPKIKAMEELKKADKAGDIVAKTMAGGLAKKNHFKSQSVKDNLVEAFGGQALKYNPYGQIPVGPMTVPNYRMTQIRSMYHSHARDKPVELGRGSFGSVAMVVVDEQILLARKSEGCAFPKCSCAEMNLDFCPHITEELDRVANKSMWECYLQSFLHHHGGWVPPVCGRLDGSSAFLMQAYLMKVGPFCPQASWYFNRRACEIPIEYAPEGISTQPATLLNFLIFPSEKRNTMKASHFIEALLGLVDTLLILHAKEFIHSDVKLNNIFVNLDHPSGKVKFVLGDMGCAKKIGTKEKATASYATRYIISWLPDEVTTQEHNLNAKVDVFSIARTAMESAELLDWHPETCFLAAQLKAGMADLVWLATHELEGARCDMIRVKYEVERWLGIQEVVELFE